MSAVGELPKLDLIIHADTSWERQATLSYIEKYTPFFEQRGIPVVMASSLSARNPAVHKSHILIPAIFLNRQGKPARLRRQCTGRWKIDVVRQIIRQELEMKGLRRSPGLVEQWLGISWDEAHRAKNSDVKYITIRHPLLEQPTRMKRFDCIKWLEHKGFETPVKSACTHCTYHDNAAWERMKRENGPDWRQAVEFDQAIRDKSTYGKYGQLYVHRSVKPLTLAVKLPEDEGYTQPDLMPGPGCDSAGYCWE